jgi:ubiquinone/menaquinone biosynthesis C-methylase UbiE
MLQAAYTPGYSPQITQFMARRTAESHAAFFLPYLRPGMTVLDCGCGPGTITLDLARRVAPGQVIGIDQAASQIELAQAAAQEVGMEHVTFRAASIYELPFADASFDAVFSHALFEHLPDPLAALAEVHRVLKPGGWVGLCSPDWGGFLVAPPSPGLGEALHYYMDLQTQNGGNVLAGRYLGQWLTATGFGQVQMSARYECYADRPLIGEYLAAQLDRVQNATAAQMAQQLRDWQLIPGGLFAQAWVSALGQRLS